MVNREAYDSNTLYVTVDENQLIIISMRWRNLIKNLYESTNSNLEKLRHLVQTICMLRIV